MIVLAEEIENDNRSYLQVMDISVKRNALGTQIDSFKVIPAISNESIELAFTRTPYIQK